MKNLLKYFLPKTILLLTLLTTLNAAQAQTIKAGDVVYFQAYKVSERRYLTTQVYVIATVKSVIGSSAILDTQMYLYKCRAEDASFMMGTTLEIAKPYGLGHLYETWRASEKKDYRYPVKGLLLYNARAEEKLTKGKIKNNTKGCMVLTN
jgi:hypothetical protein